MEVKKYGQQILIAVLVFIVSFIALKFIFGEIEAHETASHKKEVGYLAENMLGKLKLNLDGYENIPHVWSGIVRANNGNIVNFEEISQQLYAKNPTISAIELAPGGIVTYCYPKNNDVLGHNLFVNDKRKDDAAEARDNVKTVISGPFDLVQGGSGIIIRCPITLDGNFWGFSIIVLNPTSLLTDVDFDNLDDKGYDFQLMKEEGAEELLVFGHKEEIVDPVEAGIMVGSRNWTLKISPKAGWVEKSTLREHNIAAVVISLLFAVGAFLELLLMKRKRRLEEIRSDLIIQVRALDASEKANKLQAKALEASRRANDMQAEALEASRRANKAQLEALEQAKRENVKQAAALEASEAANRAKTEFISRISHDIRTPIGAIQNLTEFALRDMGSSEKLKADLEKIQTSNKFLLSLINDVLDISRVDSGRIELFPEPYPYREYADNIRHIMEPMCAERGLTFEMVDRRANTTDEERGVIVADKVRINQIVLNILSNAVKYTDRGGKVRYISESHALENGTVVYGFTVEDTGIGMSKEFQKTMFEEFAQEFDNPRRRKGMTGTGLGLSIVKRMVDIMRGTITVESELGKGTAITVKIPFPNALLDPEYKKIHAAKHDKAGKKLKFAGRVLLAEDNEINQEIARRILEECGLDVDLVKDGQEAVDKFFAEPEGTYDAIFMDIQMPNLNGYEATEKIRAGTSEYARNIPITAMTADAFEDAVKKAERAGMTEYITKPLNVEFMKQVMLKIGIKSYS